MIGTTRSFPLHFYSTGPRAILPNSKPKGNASTRWMWRTILGVSLIALSFWGVRLCHGWFLAFFGPNPSFLEVNSAAIAGWAAWLVFFGPILIAGLVTVWSALRKLNLPTRVSALSQQSIADGEKDLHDGLERLDNEEVLHLTNRANQIAVVLGLAVGIFFLLLGVFGLIVAARPSLTVTTYFSILSGISILAGLGILRNTFRKEDNAWLLPLKLFLPRVWWLHSVSFDSHQTGRSEHLR